MNIDAEEKEVFLAEVRERIVSIEESILSLEESLISCRDESLYKKSIDSLLREAHNIKGTSATVGYGPMESLTHAFESYLVAFRKKECSLSPMMIELSLKVVDYIKLLCVALEKEEDDLPDFSGLLKQLAGIEKPPAVATQKQEKKPDDPDLSVAKGSETTVKAHPAKGRALDTVRITLRHLYELSSLSGELSIHFRQAFESLDLFRSKMPLSLKNELAYFEDCMETLSYSVKELQDQVLKMRLVPISGLFSQFSRMVRDLSHQTGKEVSFEVSGGETQIDRALTENLKDPLMHILRNAIDHGIESPEDRKKKKKEVRGNISLRAFPRGDGVIIEVRDDGKGIDAENIKRAGITRGFISPEKAMTLAEEDLLQLIFLPGFSTAKTTTKLSGRGVGLDVLKKKIEELRGDFSFETRKDEGSLFTISLPVTLTLVRLLLVASGKNHFAIPSNHVEKVLSIEDVELMEIMGEPAIKSDGEIFSVYTFGKKFEKVQGGIFLIIRVRGERLAFYVDSIIEEEEMPVKPLPYILGKNDYFSGATFSGESDPVLILNLQTFISLIRESRFLQELPKESLEAVKEASRILVIDDSSLVREAIGEILKLQGYRVDLAKDGIEGVRFAKENKYDLIITDLEMPGMHGFQVVEILKHDNTCKDIPLVILTVTDSDEVKKKGLSLGADAYVMKGSLRQQGFLELIESLV